MHTASGERMAALAGLRTYTGRKMRYEISKVTNLILQESLTKVKHAHKPT